MHILILLSYFFALILAKGGGSTILDLKSGVICSPVVQSKSNKGHIHLYVDSISTKDHTTVDSLRFPALIFRATHIANFTDIPPPEVYYEVYQNNPSDLYAKIIDSENVKFKLEPFEGFHIDSNKVWNDFITLDHDIKEEQPHVDVKFVVPETGIYCVYIAPPVDQGILDIKVPVQFKNEYGNLSYTYYKIYTDLRVTIILGIILFAVLFHHILKLIDKDFNNLNKLSIISKGIIFYVLGPYITVVILSCGCLFILNNISSSSQGSVFVGKLSSLINVCFNCYIQFVFLLFTMGYGVIYYHNGQSNQYRMFPQKQLSRAFGLLIANIFFYILLLIFDSPSSTKMPYLHGVLTSSSDSGPNSGILLALNFILFIYSLFWFIAPIVYYFKTKKLIASFPPSSGGGTESNSSDRVVRAFRLSIWIIIGVPFVVALVAAFFIISNIQESATTAPRLPPPTSKDREIVYHSLISFWSLEILELQSGVVAALARASIVYVFILVISMFFIWVKDNNGLVVDPQANDPVQYSEVPEFDISDEE
ncbi:hypothetical protein JA1_004452 [Spathaspora sp. JA1]|nr:hypothetical protein JA1_004452 [Spathaspora sp. JA1]